MDLRTVTIDVALGLHDIIRPHLGKSPGQEVVGEAKSGDYTFRIDEKAEEALPGIVRRTGERSGRRLAYYSEDRGLVADVPDPEYVLIVDPIDGTRPALCGFESCCISVALAPLSGGEATREVPLSAVEAACLLEIKTGQILSARRGRGVHVGSAADRACERQVDGHLLSSKSDLQHLFWAHEICGRPMEAHSRVLGTLVDSSSFGGGCFVFNSSSYAISRIVLGQLDAYVDPFAALLRGKAAERWEEVSRRLFKGKVFGLFPYDVAAAILLAEEAGVVVTDARGGSIGGTNLLDSSERAVMSCVAAANSRLHETVLKHVREGIARAEEA